MENGQQPATKQDLIDLEQRLEGRSATKQDLSDLEQRLAFTLSDLEQRLAERFAEAVHNSETRLLKAFYGFTEATQKHFIDLDRSDSSLRERLGVLEVRLTEVERRLNTPPAH